MKKQLLCVLFILIICIVVTSCSGNYIDNDNTESNGDSENIQTEVEYREMNPFFTEFRNVQELVERSNLIIIGRVTDISFQVWDITTAQPPTEETEYRHRWLYTIYDIDVITVYKGEVSGSIQMSMSGGLRDYRVQEQLDLIREMEAWPNNTISIMRGMPEIKVGETYLFVLHQFADNFATLTNLNQAVYSLNNPFEKIGPTSYWLENPENYYHKSTDQYGRPIISAKDVISFFGNDEWDTFWTQWQRDNPRWETWINREAVERALSQE